MATARRRDDDDEDAEAQGPSDAELEQSRMPFLSHLRELRDRVRNAALFFGAGFVVCFLFADEIYAWLRQPVFDAWEAKNASLVAAGKPALGDPALSFGSLTEPFWVNMSVAMWAGIFVASPFIFYQLWRFIAPGLYKRERRITVSFAVSSAVMFSGGAVFCFYFVLPNLYDFLLGYAKPENKPILMMQSYLDLTRDMMLAFGAVFELPLFLYFLAMIGVVTHRGLWKFNRWFVVIAFIIGAILTPSPDVVSQIMMAMPMIVLYNISILLAWTVTAKREKADAALRKKEQIADEEEREERRVKQARYEAEQKAAAAAAPAAAPDGGGDGDGGGGGSSSSSSSSGGSSSSSGGSSSSSGSSS
ncbi:MAG TPA: twin-arginine translocase subunit TatC [Kofleriaceae bacterium]|nr:twin-arginine translocase subunit TatC [Kofleriaceae bacterium]